MRRRKAFDSGLGASARLSEVAQWPRLDRSEPRLQAAWHDNAVCGARGCDRKDHRDAFKTPPPRRVSRLHEQPHRGFSKPPASRYPRQSQHPQEERALAQGPSQCAISFHADKRVLAQSGRGMVLDLAGAVAQRRVLHKPQTARAAHQCLHQSLQRQSSALRLDQEKGPSTPIQRPTYHSALIPGTRSAFPWFESYQAASASLYDQVWMTGWRFTSSMPAIMRSLSSCFEVTRMWRRTDRANLEKKPSMRLSHEPCLGVKVNSKRPGGRASSQAVVSLDMCAE